MKSTPDGKKWVPGRGWTDTNSYYYQSYKKHQRENGPKGTKWVPGHGYENKNSYYHTGQVGAKKKGFFG